MPVAALSSPLMLSVPIKRRPDNIVFDITPNVYGGIGISAGGYGHPTCINTGNPATLPAVE
jgi:hypothetical protein